MVVGGSRRQFGNSARFVLSLLAVFLFGASPLAAEGAAPQQIFAAATVQQTPIPLSPLQELVDSSEEGATIHLPPGEYVGPLVIEKSIRLIGAGTGKTVIRAPQTASAVITMTSDRGITVELENLQIRGVDASAAYPQGPLCHGVSTLGAVHVILNNVLIQHNSGHGVIVSGHAAAFIENSTIDGNGEAGVVLGRTASATMIANAISGNAEDGILVEDGASVIVERHRILGNGEHGVAVRGLARASVEFSLIADNHEDGIHATHGSRVELLSNEIVDNIRYGLFAQMPANLDACVDNEIEDNNKADCSQAAAAAGCCP